MKIADIWNKIFGNKSSKRTIALDLPLYTSSFGNDVFESDIVIACIHAIAEECSKMVIKSIKEKDGTIITNNDSLNKLFRGKPNPLMTLKDMLYWTAWRLETKSNAYWYPEVEIVTYGDGRIEERVTAIYPINSTKEEMYYNEKTGDYYIRFYMADGNIYDMEYKYVIHLKKNFGSNNFFFGEVNRKELLKNLKTLDLVTSLLPKGLQASMQVKGVLHAKSLSEIEGLKKFKSEFESTLESGKTGVAVMDVAGEFKPVAINPQLIDPNILSYLENKILKTFGVPMSILFGNASEDDWASFYQKNIEPFKIELEQASTAVLFNQREQDFGNKIRCYDKLVQHYRISTRLAIIKELGARNYLSRSEQRELAGYEPDGGPEKVSLNFVDSDKANKYQGVGGSENEDEQENT